MLSIAPAAFAGPGPQWLAATLQFGVVESVTVSSLLSRFGVAMATTLAVAALLFRESEEWTRARVGEIGAHPGRTLGFGIAGITVYPILMLVCSVTVVGLVLVVLGVFAFVLVVLIGTGISVLWIGSLLSPRDRAPGWTEVGIGSVVYAVTAAIPGVGVPATLLLSFLGFGVTWRAAYDRWLQ